MAAPKRGPFLFQHFEINEGGGQVESLNANGYCSNWWADPISGSAFLINITFKEVF